MSKIRIEVASFSVLMEKVLKENDHKDHFSRFSIGWLLSRLKDEVKELEEAFDNCDACSVRKEAVDVANFAMMISSNITPILKRNYELTNQEK